MPSFNKSRESFIKTKNDTDYTQTAIAIYEMLSKKYGYAARITDIFNFLKESFSMEEFLTSDYRDIRNIEVESWLIDQYTNWLKGLPVDFVEVYRALETAGDFSISEKKKFHDGLVEERLWAIFMVFEGPDKQLNYNETLKND